MAIEPTVAEEPVRLLNLSSTNSAQCVDQREQSLKFLESESVVTARGPHTCDMRHDTGLCTGAYACPENALAYLVLLGFGALGASWRTSLSVADWNGEVIQTDQHDSRDRQGAGDGFCRSRRPHHRLSHTNTPLGAARTRRRGVLRQRLCRREVAAGLASTTYTDVGILANSRFAEFFLFFCCPTLRPGHVFSGWVSETAIISISQHTRPEGASPRRCTER